MFSLNKVRFQKFRYICGNPRKNFGIFAVWILIGSFKFCNCDGPDKFMTSRNMIRSHQERLSWDVNTRGEFVKPSDEHRTRRKRSLPNAEDSKTALDKHNYYRSIIGDEGEEPMPSNMMYMSWDPSLSITSLIYARKCVFEHSTPEERSTEHFPDWNGENLWAGSGQFAGSNFNPEVGIESWFMEYKDYEFDTHYCVPGKQCGHYTQVVWAESYKLGCAWVNCSTFDTTQGDIWHDAAYMVCHYAPGGNSKGKKLYKIGDRCSECHSNDTCPDGRLCRNPERDAILPAPSDGGHIFGLLLCVLSLLILLAVAVFFIYSHKNDFLKTWRERRKISHGDDAKDSQNTQANATNGTSLPGGVH